MPGKVGGIPASEGSSLRSKFQEGRKKNKKKQKEAFSFTSRWG